MRAKPKSKASKGGFPVRWDGGKSVSANASARLPELARGFLAAGNELMTAKLSFKSLHRFRLLTKRFRYTLEMFRPCYGAGLDQRIESLRQLQQYLGDVNDCATTQDLLASSGKLPRAERERLKGILTELAEARVATLYQYWKADFAPESREKWWIDYLARFARTRR
jgi:CHAD domain-containing protein